MEDEPQGKKVTEASLIAEAKAVLKENDQGAYTIPAYGLYPHQWLWDSCFIAIGLRQYDVSRAQVEILSLLRGQWQNGMIPHVVINDHPQYKRDREFWRSKVSPNSPDDVATSGITQPPMVAEAVVRIGEKLDINERRTWYRKVFPGLLKYHQWLYEDRDPHQEGLVLLIHPWETGLDNTPPWMSELHEHLLPWWIRQVERSHLSWIMNFFRRDTRIVPAMERFSNIELLALFDAQRRLRRKEYDIDKILDHSLFAIEDLTFNSIFIRANQHLVRIAKSIREELPAELIKRMAQTEKTFEDLWDPYSGQYYSRDFITHDLLKQSTLATLMPLYAGSITQERAGELVHLLENHLLFGLPYPVPSVPADSPWFKPKTYWQGPTWINTNWLIIDGLQRYGFTEHAEALKQTTLELVVLNGFREYFDPETGEAAGIDKFSWSAALSIDLLHAKQRRR